MLNNDKTKSDKRKRREKRQEKRRLARLQNHKEKEQSIEQQQAAVPPQQQPAVAASEVTPEAAPANLPQKTISQKQLEANRENAQKSTGATTPEGQARSRMNALRWGFNAQDDVLPWEDPRDYKAHCLGVIERYDPQDNTESYLVRRIASAEWRLFRVDRVEAMIYEACEGNALLLTAELTRLYQNENRLERVRTRALKELKEHRQAKANGGAPAGNGQSGSRSREELDLQWAMITAEAGHSVNSAVVDKVIRQQTPPTSVMQGGNLSQQVRQGQAKDVSTSGSAHPVPPLHSQASPPQ